MSPETPWFLVCEDGDEYTARFSRFLGAELGFRRGRSLDEAATQLAAEGAAPAGLLLDLDFRRTPADALVDEHGATAARRTAADHARLAADQGLLILRALRARGHATPAVLFADLDDGERAAFLRRTFAPLEIVDSRTGLPAIAALLRRLAARDR